MKTIRTHFSLAQADLDKSVLEAAGIPCFLADESCAVIAFGETAAGYRLQVEDTNIERALEVLGSKVERLRTDEEGIVSSSESTRGLLKRIGVIGAVLFAFYLFMLLAPKWLPEDLPVWLQVIVGLVALVIVLIELWALKNGVKR